MTANINPDTGIAYGCISANSLDPDIVQELQDNGTDVYYADAVRQAQSEAAQDLAQRACSLLETELSLSLDEDALFEMVHEHVKGAWEGSRWETQFNDDYQPDEPVHEGTKDGVKYRTSWLGGALNVFIFESPHITETAVQCSPCVPGAGNLDQVGEGHYQCYDVPPEWRDDPEPVAEPSDDEVGEWVGQHYAKHFPSMSPEDQEDMRNRYKVAHGEGRL